MEQLLQEISQCKICKPHLDLGARPVVSMSKSSKILVIGQAPGTKVHASGIPWDDASGKRLRDWLGVDESQFYDNTLFGIMPMGFCYPGEGKSGDLPPRKECAPLWHAQLLAHSKKVELILLIGKYAQDYYLKDLAKHILTETVRNFHEYLPLYLPIPHPSPRNGIWLKKHGWFEEQVLPILKKRVQEINLGLP
jgi:uracil-DNA glycosylase